MSSVWSLLLQLSSAVMVLLFYMKFVQSLLKRYQKFPTGFLLTLTAIISFLFFLWGIDSWKFSYAGDDWPFYIYAVKLLRLPFFLDPFSFDGVYFTHSVLVSMYQALFMRVLGPTNFAWRLSNIILIFPISFFFYRFVRDSFTKDIAVLSTILLQSSFFLANFFKIGYDNPQGFTAFIICLYLVNRLSQHPTRRLAALVGFILGISSYIYMGLAFPLFLWPYFLPLLRNVSHKQTKVQLAFLVGFYILAMSSLLLEADSFYSLTNALGENSTFPLNTIISGFFLFYKNNDYLYNHFVVGPYLDNITQVFCLIGTFIVFLKFKKKPYLFFVLSYLTTTIFIGATASYKFFPTTRGLFLLPFGFIFAGIGLHFVVKKIKNKSVSFIFCWYVIFAIFLLNVYQSQIGVFANQRYNISGYTGMSLLLKSMMDEKSTHNSVTILVSHVQGISQYLWLFPFMVKAYNLTTVPYTIIAPNDFTCPKSNTTVLLFKTDTFAREKITEMKCRNASVTYLLLLPSITFY